MSFSVNTNAGAFAALQNLGTSDKLLATTQARINTGLKVASAKDSAATFSIAQSMRADLAGYNAVMGSLDRAQSELDIAIAGAEAISDLLIEMKEKAVAAKDSGLDSSSRSSLNDDYQQLLSQIDSIANNAVFNGKNLLTGDTLTAITDASGDTTLSTSVTSLTAANLNLDATSLTSSGGTSNTQVPISDSVNFDHLDAFNNYMAANHNAIYTDGGRYNQGSGLIINGSDQTAVKNAFAAYYGVAMSEGGTAIWTTSSNLYVTGTGASAEFTTAATSGGAGEAVTNIEAALDTVNDALSSLGAMANRVEIQKGFSGKLSDGIDVGIGNLVDADMARESANLQAFQTKQQLGLQALSIANQAPQSVLSLFR